MKYQNRMDIVAIILESANGRQNKIKMMYNAFISYSELREYLAVLQENGLLEYELGTHIYKITDKGKRFLQIYNHVGDLIASSDSLILGKEDLR